MKEPEEPEWSVTLPNWLLSHQQSGSMLLIPRGNGFSAGQLSLTVSSENTTPRRDSSPLLSLGVIATRHSRVSFAPLRIRL
jgi:hypothetical protein